MRRVIVGLLAGLSLACSNATNPLADPVDSKAERAVAQAPGSIPYIQGVHAAALPAFDDPALVPRAFNDWGEVVGDSFNLASSTPSTVFKWQATRGFQFLRLNPDSIPFASAVSVNDHGQVAVQLQPAGQPIEATIWDWFGHVKVLRPLGRGFSCEPKSMNNSGIVLAVCYVPGQSQGANTYPTVWTPFGNPDGLHVGGGGSPILGIAGSISDAGYIAGQTPNSTGFVFTPTKQEILLPPARATYPTLLGAGVNDSGWVAGMVFDTVHLHFEPAIWARNDSLYLPYPASSGEGGMNSISDDGIAVGSVVDSVTGLGVPVIWTRANGLQRLPGLEGGALLAKESGTAGAINHVHQILGNIVMSTGRNRAVVWTLPAVMSKQ
jgi:hypothetical protein